MDDDGEESREFIAIERNLLTSKKQVSQLLHQMADVAGESEANTDRTRTESERFSNEVEKCQEAIREANDRLAEQIAQFNQFLENQREVQEDLSHKEKLERFALVIERERTQYQELLHNLKDELNKQRRDAKNQLDNAIAEEREKQEDLQDRLEKLENQSEDFEDQIEKLNQERDQLEKDLEGLREEQAALNDDRDRLTRDIEDLKDDHAAEVEALRKSLESKKSRLDELKEQLARTDEVAAAASAQLRDLEGQMNDMAADADAKDKNLEATCQEYEDKIEKLRKAHENQLKKLQRELVAIEDSMNQDDESNLAADRVRAEAENAIERLQDEFQVEKDELARNHADQLELQKQNYADIIDTVRAELDELTKIREDLESQLDSLDEETRNKNGELEDLREKLEQAERDLGEREKINFGISKELKKFDEALQESEAERKRLQSELADLSSLRAEDQEQISQLENQMEELEGDKATLNRMLRENQARLKKAEDELAREDEDIQHLGSEKEDLSSRVSKLKTKIRQLSEDGNAKSERIDQLENELSLLRKEFEKLQGTDVKITKDASRRVRDLEDENRELTNELNASRDAIKKLELEISELREEQAGNFDHDGARQKMEEEKQMLTRVMKRQKVILQKKFDQQRQEEQGKMQKELNELQEQNEELLQRLAQGGGDFREKYRIADLAQKQLQIELNAEVQLRTVLEKRVEDLMEKLKDSEEELTEMKDTFKHFKMKDDEISFEERHEGESDVNQSLESLEVQVDEDVTVEANGRGYHRHVHEDIRATSPGNGDSARSSKKRSEDEASSEEEEASEEAEEDGSEEDEEPKIVKKTKKVVQITKRSKEATSPYGPTSGQKKRRTAN
eukprot:TRINITY_DN259_c1_g1_i1.p1 TRINITY_DN259_c1_g1~~TRINITY_DN259_c1_g1_i1.p1  ORF type:complete len:908 (+),score=429.73 TRINITY_DN259_c1_g1_i1:150-2726(+)